MSKIKPPPQPNFQDEYFLNLNSILVPIEGKEFEALGLEIAFFVAHEYGAKINLLHVGKKIDPAIDKYLSRLSKYEIDHNFELIDNFNVAKTIVNYWKKYKHELVILSAKRKPTLFDKIFTKSVSNTVIPLIDTEILQVYPPKLKKLKNRVKEIAVLLPYSERDPFLLRWASAIAAPQRGAKIKVYHIAEVPATVPLEGAKDEYEIKKEEKLFKNYVKKYAEIFGQIIRPTFIIGHDVVSSLEFIFGQHEPDLVLIGHTKVQKWYEKFRKPLSYKIRDHLTETGVAIHHMM